MCVFRETLSTNRFTELQSVSNATWRIGFRRNGRPMLAMRRRQRQQRQRRRQQQRCFQFLKHNVHWRRRIRPQSNWPSSLEGRFDVHQQHVVEAKLQRRRRRRRRRRRQASDVFKIR